MSHIILTNGQLITSLLCLQGGHVLTPLPAATPLKPGSAVSLLKSTFTYYILWNCSKWEWMTLILKCLLCADMPIFWSPACHSQWTWRRIRWRGGGIPGEIVTLALHLAVAQIFQLLLPNCVSLLWLFLSQVFRKPWPGIMRGVYGNQERFESTYFRKFPGFYVTGDGNVATHPYQNLGECYFWKWNVISD